ncbi:Uncharacterised protein [uncultured archaeon]|nr:Uncharacterised protein [uncultured archaeon]
MTQEEFKGQLLKLMNNFLQQVDEEFILKRSTNTWTRTSKERPAVNIDVLFYSKNWSDVLIGHYRGGTVIPGDNKVYDESYGIRGNQYYYETREQPEYWAPIPNLPQENPCSSSIPIEDWAKEPHDHRYNDEKE